MANSTYKTILPSSASDLEKALDINNATRFDHDLPIGKLWSFENCPLELLPFLAWALSVDNWNSNWPENIQRQVIASSAYVHRFKGTVAGMRAALMALDLGVGISEWFEHDGAPYTFKADVMVTTRGLTDDEFEDIISIIANTKNARSHLSQLRVYLTAKNTNHFATIAVIGERIDVWPWMASVPTAQPIHHFGITTHIAETITTGENFV